MTAYTASENDGAFQEVFLLGVTKKGSGSATQYAAIIEDITPEIGDKEGEGVAMGNGGRIWKRTPQADSEVTMKIYPLKSSDLFLEFSGDTIDSTAAHLQTNTRVRDLYQVAMLFTDDSTASTAEGTTTVGNAALRIIWKDARVTSFKPSFDDKILSAEVKFKCPAFGKTGTGLITVEHVTSQSAAGLSAAPAYS